MTLPYQKIKDLIWGVRPMIFSRRSISDRQIQPASFDLTLGERVYRTSSSFLPKGNERIKDILADKTLYDFELKPGTVLEPNSSYIIPLAEYLDLAPGVWGYANPKSSIGRVGLFVRLLVDGSPRFDFIPAGYKGPLYLEIMPLDFVVKVAPGMSCNQVRFRAGRAGILSDAELRLAHAKYGLVFDNAGFPLPQEEIIVNEGGLMLTVDLGSREIVGFRAKHDTTKAIDLTRRDVYEPSDFWEPIKRPTSGEMILVPNNFYLLASRERVCLPPSLAGEIASYDPSSGEMRSHYAGFFDPGFGWSNQSPHARGGDKGGWETVDKPPPVSSTGQALAPPWKGGERGGLAPTYPSPYFQDKGNLSSVPSPFKGEGRVRVGAGGSTAVLEIRAHNIPFRLTNGQIVCKMIFERMLEVPTELYGAGIGSSYTSVGPMLSKHFKQTWI